ncbi:ERAD-associated E3 ubiquitin-protein ligase HRD1B [Selaginella moellendorffii]|uniref:ERAD-associated E3 ubiquitin-protein ligase HRD1B n=1 Tax=Selaginella moellendorffii TaxID=88036 RepID=UPI000D1C89A7|nr:ERAD-associated E3 ubiquitin-protein ligase HRD1B [Selaginella moellendorffii]|eukprot:XP_024542114.1 ERAD-associated E3 ubiquitin-protein ligase HRD1B [Selaginella moellendorffii]
MVKLGTYAAASVIGAVAVVYHAFYSREQFYPAMVYLSTSKISVLLLLNFAFVVLYAVWQLIKMIFLGSLREAEVERLNEQLWRELMEVLFAMTIFREEFNVSFIAMVTVLLFVKAFHWLAQKRVEYIEITPTVSRLSHARIASFMAFLLVLDSIFVHSSVSYLLRTKQASVSLFFAFEYVILATSVVSMFLKYSLYMGDMWMDGQWDNKAVYIFYLELVRDLLHLSLYLFFFLVIFINYGLPLHLVRELYEIFRNFKARVTDFIRYRKVTSNMNERFPDATAEELGRSDATCIICREEMSTAKKLPCGHLFHVHCLRSWLERQQTCPTCRSPVIAAEGGPQAASQRQQQQGQAPEGQATPANAAEGNVSPEADQARARMQAAAAAAAQYGSSFVYPATGASGTMSWYPMYLPLVPQNQQPLKDEAASPQVEKKATADTGGSSNSPGQLHARHNSPGQPSVTLGDRVFFLPILPGPSWPSQSKSGERSAATSSSPQQQQQSNVQHKYLQSTIELLRQQLNVALELQKSMGDASSQEEEQHLGDSDEAFRDRKGKARVDDEGSTSLEKQ